MRTWALWKVVSLFFIPWTFCVAAQEPVAVAPDFIRRASKAMAYVIGEQTEGTGSIIREGSFADLKALDARVIRLASLKKEQLDSIPKIISEGEPRFPVMECYDPHHVIVFFDGKGKPTGCIEICFTCNRVRVAPEFRTLTGDDHVFERSDLVALGRIFNDLRLPLAPYPSLEALKSSKEEQQTEAARTINPFPGAAAE